MNLILCKQRGPKRLGIEERGNAHFRTRGGKGIHTHTRWSRCVAREGWQVSHVNLHTNHDHNMSIYMDHPVPSTPLPYLCMTVFFFSFFVVGVGGCFE